MSTKGFSLHSLSKRITALVFLFAFVLTLLLGRLFFLGVINSAHLQSLAENQWTRSLPIYAQRGEIVDTLGTTLATSESCYSLFSRAREVKNPSAVAETLSKILDIKYSKIYTRITDKSSSEILIAAKVNQDEAVKITGHAFDGIYLTENSTRHYPQGNLLTQVLGFTTSDGQGQAGLELFYDQYLKGTHGLALVQSTLTGTHLENTLDTFIPATAGAKVELTINASLQKIVETELENIMTEQKARSATGILMNAKTGEILALSTKPSFDLNSPPRDDTTLLMQTVKNQAVIDVYEPGSTFKIITMAMALESGKAHLSDTFFCPGYAIVDGEKIKCWKSIGHGSQTLAEGLANSCNCVFTTLAQRIGLDDFYSYLQKFGYGVPTGISVSGESSGIIRSKSDVKVVDLARMGFGQAVAVTQIQQIVGVAAAVNGGSLLTPYLVKKITAPNGDVILENSPTARAQVISPKTSQILCDMLDLTVSMQTGKYSFVPGYAVGGKTGTTQKYENGAVSHNKYISSFVGTYPVSNPEYILLIAVDEPMAGAYYGSIVASPYAKKIFSGLFDYFGIPPENPDSILTPPASFEMPYLIGQPITKAVETLSSLNIAFEIAGEGSSVTGQLPAPGASVLETDTILIKT